MNAWPTPRGVFAYPDARPHLVLDAFQSRFMEDKDPVDLAPAHAMLRVARLSDWPVAHVMRRPFGAHFDPEDDGWRPVSGFEPTRNEMSFVSHGKTPFASRHFTDRFLDLQPQIVLFLSLISEESSLETLAYARQKGIPFYLVRDDYFIGAYPDVTQTQEPECVWQKTGANEILPLTHCLQRFAPSNLTLHPAGGP